MTLLTSENVELNYEVHGEGEPIFFLSGMTQNLIPWTLYQVPFFVEKGYQCIVLDNRDVGKTTLKSDHHYLIKDLANDVIALADHLQLDEFNLVGYSMGGMIGLQMAIDAPERIKSLCLLGTSAKISKYDRNKFNYILSAKCSLDNETFWRLILDNVVTWRIFENREAVERLLSFLTSDMYYQSIEGLNRQADAILKFDVVSELSSISVPTHIIVGEEDIMLAPRHSQHLADNIPSATISYISDAGHAAYSENADEFNKVVLASLS